jgi:glycosyltransferase involved in cell wall biosynthesis
MLSAGDLDRARARFVTVHGYLGHTDTVALIRSADLLFLPMHDLAPGARASIVPGKTYEYLAAGRPILGAVPDGDARDLLTEAGNAYLCRPRDVDAMVDAISTERARRRVGERPRSPVPKVVERFDRRRLTAQLAALFDDVLARAEKRSADAPRPAAADSRERS